METGEYSLLTAYVGVSGLAGLYCVCLFAYSLYANNVFNAVWIACVSDTTLETSGGYTCSTVRSVPYSAFGSNYFVHCLFTILMIGVSAASMYIGNRAAKQILAEGGPNNSQLPMQQSVYTPDLVMGHVVPPAEVDAKPGLLEMSSPTSTNVPDSLAQSPTTRRNPEPSNDVFASERAAPRSQYHQFD